MNMSVLHFCCTRIFLLVLSVAVALTSMADAWAVTTINAGQSVVLDTSDDLSCQSSVTGSLTSEDGIALTGTCETNEQNAEVAPRHQNIIAYTGVSSVGLPEPQRAIATARLINEIEIPVVAPGAGVDVLPAQIATEVDWSGVLFAGGFNSAFAQAVATLQVRDTTTGLVVASDTFLFERVDADFTLDFIEAIGFTDLTNSSGADVTALLVRGRVYAIEVEAKCDVSVPVAGAAVCSFFAEPDTPIPGVQDLFGGDGFNVDNITVTVGTDAVMRVANN